MSMNFGYRVGLFAVKAKLLRERATLADGLSGVAEPSERVAPATRASRDVLGFCRLHRVRPQRLREWRSEAHPQSDRRSTMSRCCRRQPAASWSACSSDRGGPSVKVVYSEPGQRNLAAVTHRIAPVPATHMTHRVASDVRDASR